MNKLISSFLLFVIAIIFFTSCRKTDAPSPPSYIPVTVVDTNYKITSVSKIDINDFRLDYVVKPPTGGEFQQVYLQWSTSPSFGSADDSLLLSDLLNTTLTGHKILKRLNQVTTYYSRIALTFKGARYYSSLFSFKTDSVMILDYQRILDRGGFTTIVTNFNQAQTNSDTSTRVWLDNYPCPVQLASGKITGFTVPSIPTKKYALRLEYNGVSVTAPDSVTILKGFWTELTPPVFPLQPGYIDNAIGYYGSCFSDQKGYIIPGLLYRQIPWGQQDWERPGYLLEFDYATKTWTRRNPPSPRRFQNPICYYYNNAIYVIAGLMNDMHNAILGRVQKVLRLDLTTLTWTELSNVPYTSMFNMVSFEFNNEFYIGLGADANNTSICCGVPLPNNKFWKYNPANDTWTALADMPRDHGQVNQNFPTGFSVNGKGYIFYGAIPIGDHSSVNYRQEFWQYDPVSNSWSQLPLPATGGPLKGEKYCIATLNGKAYFMNAQRYDFLGSSYDFTLQHNYMEYDPVTNSFTRISQAVNSTLMKPIGRTGNKLYFHGDIVGYISYAHNKTYEMKLE